MRCALVATGTTPIDVLAALEPDLVLASLAEPASRGALVDAVVPATASSSRR